MFRIVSIAFLVLVSASVAAVPVATESFHDFLGSGIAPGGGGGRLDSNHWAVSGLSDGDTAIGATALTGDFARGVVDAPVRTGGLYAFALPESAIGLGVQATGSDFTPGSLTWRIDNASAEPWRDLHIDFDFWYRNDGDRASDLTVDASTSALGDIWIALEAAARRTPGTASDANWQVYRISDAALPELSVAPLEELRLRFTVSDANSAGTRDEFALAALRLRAGDGETDAVPVAAPASGALVLPALLAMGLRRFVTDP